MGSEARGEKGGVIMSHMHQTVRTKNKRYAQLLEQWAESLGHVSSIAQNPDSPVCVVHMFPCTMRECLLIQRGAHKQLSEEG